MLASRVTFIQYPNFSSNFLFQIVEIMIKWKRSPILKWTVQAVCMQVNKTIKEEFTTDDDKLFLNYENTVIVSKEELDQVIKYKC